jgi:hypothetical protein
VESGDRTEPNAEPLAAEPAPTAEDTVEAAARIVAVFGQGPDVGLAAS